MVLRFNNFFQLNVLYNDYSCKICMNSSPYLKLIFIEFNFSAILLKEFVSNCILFHYFFTKFEEIWFHLRNIIVIWWMRKTNF